MRKRHVVFPKTTRRFIENHTSIEEKQAIRQTSGNEDWKIQEHRPMAKSQRGGTHKEYRRITDRWPFLKNFGRRQDTFASKCRTVTKI